MESNLEVLLSKVARLGGEGKRAILKCSSRTNIKSVVASHMCTTGATAV